MFFQNGAGGVQPVHFRHFEIHYGDIRQQIAILTDRVLAIDGFAGNLPRILLLQQPEGLLAHKLIIVHHEDVCHNRNEPRLTQVMRKVTPFRSQYNTGLT
jgi:hypothetical protein